MENLDRRAFISEAVGFGGSMLLGLSLRGGTAIEKRKIKQIDRELAVQPEDARVSGEPHQGAILVADIALGVGVVTGQIAEIGGIIGSAVTEADISNEEDKRVAEGLGKTSQLSRRTLFRRTGQAVALGGYIYATYEYARAFDTLAERDKKLDDLKCGGVAKPNCIKEKVGNRVVYTLKTPTPSSGE